MILKSTTIKTVSRLLNNEAIRVKKLSWIFFLTFLKTGVLYR
jgi:hypothetical protein